MARRGMGLPVTVGVFALLLSPGNADLNQVAQQFAPVVYHAPGEPNLPCSVDWFLGRTSLWFCDRDASPSVLIKLADKVTQDTLVDKSLAQATATGDKVFPDGSRSTGKRRTFFLQDLPPEARCGSTDPADWTTYYHAYANDQGGITIQYWRLHAFNTGHTASITILLKTMAVEMGFHGGDWEGIHVVLDSTGKPVQVKLLGHTSISEYPWEAMEREGDHVVVYSERNGHATLKAGSRDGIRQETWGGNSGAKVMWPGRGPLAAGNLLNVGQKVAPANNQCFIKYSGLWGSPSSFPLHSSEAFRRIYYISSGYWGPAYNETDMRSDGYVSAWGAGAQAPLSEVEGVKEYYPAGVTP